VGVMAARAAAVSATAPNPAVQAQPDDNPDLLKPLSEVPAPTVESTQPRPAAKPAAAGQSAAKSQ